MTVSEAVASFVVQLSAERLPSEVVQKARACLVNGYGIALAGGAAPHAAVARRTALAQRDETLDGATVLGHGRKVGLLDAVFANAALFHARVQDDTCGAAHFGAVVIPVLTALLEADRGPVANFLPALVAGYEVGGLFESACAAATTKAGFRATPLYGALAAAAAASRFMDLTQAQVAVALANAVAFAGGNLQAFNDGTDEWRYQLGIAGIHGVVAAQLADSGSVGAPHAFEGNAGFVRTFARVALDLEARVSRLGRDWSMHRVTFKPFPVCAFNQSPVTAALRMRERLGNRAVREARVRMNPYEAAYAGMDAKGPFSSITGTLMSMPFCIASTLIRGFPTMRAMTTYDDPEVNALVERVQLLPDERVPPLSCVIDATVADDSPLSETLYAKAQDYSFSFDEVEALVRRVGAETGVPADAYDRIVSFAKDLPLSSVDTVLAAFMLHLA